MLANPMLDGVIFGLEWEDHKLTPSAKLLPCCAGRGFQVDKSGANQSRCSLKRRLVAIEKLQKQFQMTWPKTNLQRCIGLPSAQGSRILRQLSETIKGYRPQASELHGTLHKPSELWAMAMAAVWRFDTHAHLVNLNRMRSMSQLLPPPEMETGRLAIFVEQVDNLWNSAQVDALETLISYAYNSNAYLWIEYCHENAETSRRSKPAGSIASVADMVALSVKKARGYNPRDRFSLDCQSRMRSLCSLPKPIIEEEFDLD